MNEIRIAYVRSKPSDRDLLCHVSFVPDPPRTHLSTSFSGQHMVVRMRRGAQNDSANAHVYESDAGTREASDELVVVRRRRHRRHRRPSSSSSVVSGFGPNVIPDHMSFRRWFFFRKRPQWCDERSLKI